MSSILILILYNFFFTASVGFLSQLSFLFVPTLSLVTVNDLFSQEFTKQLMEGKIDPELGYTFMMHKYSENGFATESFPDKYDLQLIGYYLEKFFIADNTTLPFIFQLNG
jgi:hypothetical protein